MELEKLPISTSGYHNHNTRYKVYSPQFPSPYHHPSFSLQRPTLYPRNQRFPQRPTVLQPNAPTFYPHQRTQNNNTVFQPHQTRELMIVQGRINFKQVDVLLDTGSSVNIIPKNISQIKGYHNVEYIKTKIATINGEIELSSDLFSVFGLAIHQNDHQARRRFVEWAQNEIAVVPDFHKRILFSDEAHFWLNGYVNKQNCHIWSEANPQVYVETPLHPEKLTVWCALWAGGIIGPHFFKNYEDHNVTVNGDRYRAMITNFFIPELNNHDVQELRFQQDGATCHTARATIDLLKDMLFGDRLISRFGPVNWPPRSCDLTPLDYFLWGYVKSLVYADKPQTLDHLEDNIRRVIADIRPQMLEKVIENWTSRLDYIRANRGSPMPEIIFKM
ncbi:uncharacterized protein TNCV_4150371 [Trichonephila clavipes]|uniref:Transposable element Tc3 transposase n=1 Tax=Trichonephila clavipes TaxID=2585209 RepID=A0A8X7BE84_TRICX|nr:uncharacterized protein TNCV_4150371 [Trichonephila clavipes]